MLKNNKVLLILVTFLLLVNAIPVLANTLNVAIPQDPDSFDPLQAVAAASGEIAFNIYEGLVKATSEGGVEPALATHWTVDETNTVYTFYLREAYFHDGTRVTVEDVVAALRKARDPDYSVSADQLSMVEEIFPLEEAVQIKLREPHGAFIYSLTELYAAIFPNHARELSHKPIGTGPYFLKHWHPNKTLELSRFSKHWSGELPFYEQVNFEIIPDENSAVLNLKAGRVDLIPRLETSVLHQVEGDNRLKVFSDPMNLVQLFAINNARAPFNDLKVRQALALAINREEILLGAAWGHGSLLYSGISPAMGEFFNSELELVNPYDPERAKGILKELGHDKLKFTLVLPANYPLHVQAGEIAAQQWKAIGLDVKLEIVEWGTWLERVYTQRDYDISIIGLAGRLDPHAIFVRYTTDNSRNFFNFSNTRFDQLVERGLKTVDEERQQVYKEAQAILAEELPGIFIMDPPQLAVMAKRIQGWKYYPAYVVDVASLYE